MLWMEQTWNLYKSPESVKFDTIDKFEKKDDGFDARICFLKHFYRQPNVRSKELEMTEAWSLKGPVFFFPTKFKPWICFSK